MSKINRTDILFPSSAIAQQTIPHASHYFREQLTLSLGIASVIPTVETSWKALVTQADLALYQSKTQGRNCYFLGKRASSNRQC